MLTKRVLFICVLCLLLSSAFAQRKKQQQREKTQEEKDRENWRKNWCGDDSCYDILDVSRNATQSQIKKQYYALSKIYHPDKNKTKEAEETFKRMAVAWEIIGDVQIRKEYDDVMDMKRRMFVPKENPMVVFCAVLLLLVGMFHAYEIAQHKALKRRVLSDPRVKKHLPNSAEDDKKKKKKEKKDKDKKEEVPDIPDEDLNKILKKIDLTVVGWTGGPPDWKLLPIRLVKLPLLLASNAVWGVSWVLQYYVLKREYSDSAKAYLTWTHLRMSQPEWDALSEQERDNHLSNKYWTFNSSASSSSKKSSKIRKAKRL